MKLKYGCAVVSFCPDLTSATTASIPLAGLLVGELENERIAAVAWLQLPDQTFADDPFALAMMRDLPAVLRTYVDDAWGHAIEMNRGQVGDALLAELHNSLRNTLHVSEISTDEKDVTEATDVSGVLISELNRRLSSVIERAKTRPSRPSQPTLPVRTGTLVSAQPEGIEYWKVRPQSKRQVAEECRAD